MTSVIPCRLDKLVPDATIRESLRNGVARTHKATLLGYELAALHITRCLEEQTPLPTIDQAFFKRVLQEVTYVGEGDRVPPDRVAIHDTCERYMPGISRAQRSGLDNVLMLQAGAMLTAFQNNAVVHFKKRVQKYVLWTFHERGVRMPKETRADLLKVAYDLTSFDSEEPRAPQEYHEWIAFYRWLWGLDDLRAGGVRCVSTEDAFQRSPRSILLSMRHINMAMEGSGRKCHACCPLRRTFRPCFVLFDTKSIQALASTGVTEHDRTLKTRNDARRRAREASMRRREELGMSTEGRARLANGDEKRVFHQLCVAHREEGLKLKRAASLWLRSTLSARVERARRGRQRRYDRAVLAIQRFVGPWLTRKRGSLGRKKLEIREMVFRMSAISIPGGKRPTGSISTDGVTARVLIEGVGGTSSNYKSKKPKASTRGAKKRRVMDPECLERPGLWNVHDFKASLYAMDEAKRVHKMERMQIVGLDPGKIELACLQNIDEWGRRRAAEMVRKRKRTRHTPGGLPIWQCKYTSKERRHDMKMRYFEQTLAKEKDAVPDVREAEREMQAFRSKSSHLDTLSAYLDSRRSHLDSLLGFYGDKRYRERLWTRFLRKKMSMAKFVRKIRSMRRGDKGLVIAYGSAGNILGMPGGVNRGQPPCIGKGLRAELARHFVIVSTPEQHTSQTCSYCLSHCGPFEVLEQERRALHLARATTETQIRRASRYELRSLRRCNNESCARILNRDANSAKLIGRRLLNYLHTGDDIPALQMDEVEEDIDELQIALDG